jgi:hypothetical protein
MAKTVRICNLGHQFNKSSDCPVCPICEKNRAIQQPFLKILPAPARRALENANIDSLQRLSNCTETELLQLHGFGKSSITKLTEYLKNEGLKFKA